MNGWIEKKPQTKTDAINTQSAPLLNISIGTANMHLRIIYDQLNSIRCLFMSHLKWYKCVLFTKAFKRFNYNLYSRTERVVDEILSLIQRVKTKSQEQHEGKTQHERYAHGEIASTSIEASLDICNGWKIQKQLKKEKATN